MNTPNKISLIRIILIPIFIFFYFASFVPAGKLIALIIFSIACLTDFIDGYLARKYNQVTNLGKFLDSIADKLLTTTALVMLAIDQTIPNPFGIIVVFITMLRDNAINCMRQIGAANNVVIAADKLGKIKANFQFFTLIYGLLVAYLHEVISNASTILILDIIFYVALGLTTLIVIISGISYLVKNRIIFVEKKKEDNKQENK